MVTTDAHADADAERILHRPDGSKRFELDDTNHPDDAGGRRRRLRRQATEGDATPTLAQFKQ